MAHTLSPEAPDVETTGSPSARPCPGNAPRTAWDYLMYPRVLLTLIICVVATLLHIAFGLYVWLG